MFFCSHANVASGGGGIGKSQELEVQEFVFANLLATVAEKSGD
jgi:hypothetical protein